MTSRMFRALAVLTAACLIAGCRLEVIVSDGGTVQSASGLYDCAGPNYCINDIDDPDFSDTFTAVANPGYEFVRWQAGNGFSCGNSTNINCALGLPGGENGEALVATEASVYIMPIFTYLGLDTDGDGTDNRKDLDDDNDLIPDADDLCPLDPEPTCGMGILITDVVTAAGKEWAQPKLFNDVSAEQIAAQCPGGVCRPGSVLNGWALDGWLWATVDDINTLLNGYLSGYTLGPGPDRIQVPNDTYLVEPIFDSGFHPTSAPGEEIVHRFLMGLTSDDFVYEDEYGEEHLAYSAGAIDNLVSFTGDDVVFTNSQQTYNSGTPYIGAWFYRPTTP